MKQAFKKVFFAVAFVFFVAAPVGVVALPQTTHAAATNCETAVLGIPPWYRGMTKIDSNGDCAIKSPDEMGGLPKFIWTIVLNGIQIALVLTSWLALFFILYGGFLFITGGNNSSQIEKAQKSILNAIIGLVIALGSIAITNLIFGVVSSSAGPNPFGLPEISGDDIVRNGLNLLYYVAGITAVIVIIIAGINYITSAGDSGKITRAKNMILYSVIGLGVIIAAFAITNFIIARFG